MSPTRNESRTVRFSTSLTIAAATLVFLGFYAAAIEPTHAQGPFVNFESPQSPHAAAVLDDRLYVVNTPDNRLSVFDLTTTPPTLLTEIPVGLEPVAVAPRPGFPDEIWVANHLSDDVTIVDLDVGAAVGSIAMPDEPFDILFTPDGSRCYVTASQANQVVSIDPVSRTISKVFDIPMEEPRAMALSRNGKFLVVAVLESGNNTTIIPANQAPPSDPQVGLIVPDTAPMAPVNTPDKDLWIIKTVPDTLINKTVKNVGTLNFAVGVHPLNNRVYVANTEALNLVQFEPNLRGHFIDSRVTIVEKIPGGITVTPVDLNPTIDYNILPNPAAQAIALSQPMAVAFDSVSGKVYVAAFGSAKVAVLDVDGAVTNRIDVGEGPRALAFDRTRRALFVVNRLENTVSRIDTLTDVVTHVFPIGAGGFDPTPALIHEGRPFLYDARLSGNGTASCAACHIDATSDHLSWDLGDPDGMPTPGFDAAKGPMFTQSLRDLGSTEPYHWRGDRPTFLDFAGAFDSLMGAGAPLPEPDMQKFEDFVFTVKYPPNPLQPKDRGFTEASTRALDMFQDLSVFGGALACVTCHGFPFGEQPVVIPGEILEESQGFNPGLLPGAFEKTGFEETGFAFLHDGSEPTIQTFLSTIPPFPFFTFGEKNDFAELVLQWDSGLSPSIGLRKTLDDTNADDPAMIDFVNDLVVEVGRVHVDLVVHGTVLGAPRNGWFDPRIDRFVSSSSSDPLQTFTQLRDLARAGNAVLTFTAVPVGSGPRIGYDRDNDLLLDGDEAGFGADPLNPDTDNDTWLDGVEVAAGSDPNNAGSTPGSTTSPAISTVTPVAAPPWPDFERLVISGTGIELGALLEATDGGGDTTEHGLYPIGPDTWAIFESVDQAGGSTWSGLSVVVRNRDGGASSPFVIP